MTLLWLQVGNETTRMCFIEDQTARSKITWNQVCVLVRHKLWSFFYISNVYRACKLLGKRFTIFSRNLSCQHSYFRWKLVGLFFCGFRGENEKFAEIRVGSLSHLVASWLDFQCEPASRLVLPQNTTHCPRPGLEPGPLALELSALSMRPPCLLYNVKLI